MEEYNALISEANKEGLTVAEVPGKVLGDYAAMNPEAAHIMGDTQLPSKTIEIDKTLSQSKKISSLKHELIERNLMLGGSNYWPAHQIALQLENTPITPASIARLKTLGNYQIVHIHDDGDLTVKVEGYDFIVSTEGETFVNATNIVNKIEQRYSGKHTSHPIKKTHIHTRVASVRRKNVRR